MGKQNEKVNPERKRTRFAKEFKLEAVSPLEFGQSAYIEDLSRVHFRAGVDS